MKVRHLRSSMPENGVRHQGPRALRGVPPVASGGLTLAGVPNNVVSASMRAGLILAAFAVVAVAGYLVFGRGRELQGVEARKLVAAGARLLDVRSVEEFGRGHLPGAVNIPVQELDGRLGEVGPPEGEVVVYCRSGHRSSRATQVLRERGFTNVHNLGPMSAW